MHRGGAWTVCMLLAWTALDRGALAQTDDWELDEESGAERTANEELLDRLRREPIDLRSASEEDLLQIPGVRRGEAAAIIRAVKKGSVSEIRAIDFVPGVRRGTAATIAPYVTLTGPNALLKRDTRLRSIVSLRSVDGEVQMVRRRYDLRIDGTPHAAANVPLRLELRHSGVDAADGFSYARIPGPFTGWSMALGDLDVRTGSALLDGGRRTSLVRSSDWERRLLSDARVLPGYDAGTAGRGVAIQVAAGERVLQASLSTDEGGRRTGTISWTELWPFRLTTHVVRYLRSAGSSMRLEHEMPFATVSLEAAIESKVASAVASWHWQRQGSARIHSIVRLLRRLGAPGVPRAGNRTTEESGAGLSMDHVLSRRFRWHVVGDVARVAENDRVASMAWSSFTLGVGGVVQWEDHSNAGVEWERTERDLARVRRWSLRLRHRITPRLQGALTVSHRTESASSRVATAGVLAMATLSWSEATFSAHVRWTAGDGDPSVEFWGLGPGSSALGGLERYAGRLGELRGTVQWMPTHAVELGIGATWKHRPTEELRTSILLEIHL